jgi:hypothetical protein
MTSISYLELNEDHIMLHQAMLTFSPIVEGKSVEELTATDGNSQNNPNDDIVFTVTASPKLSARVDRTGYTIMDALPDADVFLNADIAQYGHAYHHRPSPFRHYGMDGVCVLAYPTSPVKVTIDEVLTEVTIINHLEKNGHFIEMSGGT